MLCHIGKYQVGGNWSDLVETCLAEFPFNVVVGGESETAMELQADIGCFPGGIRRQQLGHVRLRPARLLVVEKLARLVAHEIGGFDVDVGFCDRKLDTLILGNWAAKDDSFARVLDHAINEPVSVANAFGGDQGSFSV